MSIKEKPEEIKIPTQIPPLGSSRAKVALGGVAVAVLVAGSYAAGRLDSASATPHEEALVVRSVPATATTAPATPAAPSAATATPPGVTGEPTTATTNAQTYVASKKGSKYHLPTCPGARTIAEGNKIWFATKEEAARAGYTPAANCKGI